MIEQISFKRNDGQVRNSMRPPGIGGGAKEFSDLGLRSGEKFRVGSSKREKVWFAQD